MESGCGAPPQVTLYHSDPAAIMPPRKTRARCQICKENESKYTCPAGGCLVNYCSVSCYKQHKETACGSKPVETHDANADEYPKSFSENDEITEEDPLRPLASLKWPYVPEESAYPDPLKRDDPKPLQTAQYEAIATSSAIRTVLREHPKLKDALRTIDGLRGSAREEALHARLGISTRGGMGIPGLGGDDGMSELASAIEGAVRGSRDGLLGLDWSAEYPERE
ncbi:hypothetical protein V8E52_005976 [Russula decolorans]